MHLFDASCSDTVAMKSMVGYGLPSYSDTVATKSMVGYGFPSVFVRVCLV